MFGFSAGNSGSNGGGGSGSRSANQAGGRGSSGIEILGAFGSGGSNGGGIGLTPFGYGAGAGGRTSVSTIPTQQGNVGSQGAIIIVYTPSGSPAVNSNFFFLFG